MCGLGGLEDLRRMVLTDTCMTLEDDCSVERGLWQDNQQKLRRTLEPARSHWRTDMLLDGGKLG